MNMTHEAVGPANKLPFLIEKLRSAEPDGPILAQSLEELYGGEYCQALIGEPNMSIEEYQSNTRAWGWRFVIRDKGEVVAPVVSLVDPQKTDLMLAKMAEATKVLPAPPQAFEPHVDLACSIALNAAIGLGLQTLAVMQVSEHVLQRRLVVEINYPLIYRETGQIDVMAEIKGTKTEPDLKPFFGTFLASRFLSLLPVSGPALIVELS